MAKSLAEFSRRLITEGESAADTINSPVLIWEASSEVKEDERVLLTTMVPIELRRPKTGDPVVFEVKKSASKSNAFAMGVTVGRTDNNDIVIEDNSVSRFHAYFQQDPKTSQWKVVDAESKYGTRVGPLKLSPNQAEVVPDQSQLRFGDIKVLFFLPASFLSYVRKLIG